MDERTTLNFATFYDAIMQTNHNYMKDKFFWIIVLVIIALIVIIFYLLLNPRKEQVIKYVPYLLSNNLNTTTMPENHNYNSGYVDNQYQPTQNYY